MKKEIKSLSEKRVPILDKDGQHVYFYHGKHVKEFIKELNEAFKDINEYSDASFIVNELAGPKLI